MKEKKNSAVEYCAVSKDVANKRLSQLIENPVNKAVLDEYFMWIAILNSPISITENSIENVDSKPIDSFEV